MINAPLICSIFLSLGSCVVPCQAVAVYRGEEGQRLALIQTATSAPNHPRGLAFDHADCVSADEQQHNDI